MVGIYKRIAILFNFVAAISTTYAIVKESKDFGIVSGVFWILAVIFDFISSRHAHAELLIIKEKVKRL